MIQELMDCGPSRTYPVYYLEDAMNNLGDCFDYAVNDYGAEGSEVAELFCLSGVAREFERGNAWVVSGKSGVELFALIAERSGYQAGSMPDRSYRFEKTPEYWTGWILAYLQWRLGEPFENLLHVVPFLMCCAACTTPGTKPRRNAWRVLYAIWRRKYLVKPSWRWQERGSRKPNKTWHTNRAYRSAQSKCTNSARETSTKPR